MSSSHRPYLGLDFHDAVRGERAYQEAKWGKYRVGGHEDPEWLAILTAEVGEVAEEVKGLTWHEGEIEGGVEMQLQRLRAELIQVAAVAAAWIEDLDKTEFVDLSEADLDASASDKGE
jgi:hypothetical protein